jgi:hypothetical protein
MPKLIRFTPSAWILDRYSCEMVPGLASIVVSAGISRSNSSWIAVKIFSRADSVRREGVPPPKYIVWIGNRDLAAFDKYLISSHNAWVYAGISV